MDRLHAMMVFVRVVETGSFSEAARQIGMGQPSVSKSIAQLEARLQVRLLIRSTQGLSPTDAGLRFYERAKIAIFEADEAELEAKGAAAGLSGRLRVCTATTFARLMIIPRLPAFLAAHPDLEVDIILDDRVIDLVSEGIDLALRMGDLADSSALARRLASGRRSVLATPTYFGLHGRPSTPEGLEAHAVFSTTRPGTSWTFRKDEAESTVSLSSRLRLTAAEGIRAAVLADMGLAVTSEWMFWPELLSGAVERVLPDWSLPRIDLWAVYPTGRLASTKARIFAEFVETILR